MEHVDIPVFEYNNLTTTRKTSPLNFNNPYGAAIEVKFNDSTIFNEDTDSWHHYHLDFVDGENTIEITVTSEDGENTNIYVINITRNRSSQAVIQGLSIGGVLDYVETPLFEYNIITEFKGGHLSFQNSYEATIEVEFNGVVLGNETDYWLDFVIGVNTVEINVVSEDGENTNIYVINITRNRSSQALIQGLSIGGVLDYVETPLFEYNIITEFKGGHLGFQNSYGATIEVEFNGVVLGEETWYYLDFVDGENTIEITVTSEDGENTNIYVINITRNRSSQALIQGLSIGGVLDYVETPLFEYNIITEFKGGHLGFQNSYGATIEVEFNGVVLGEETWYYLDFVDGENTIEIKVVSEDGENTNTYVINITRNLSSQAVISNLFIGDVLEEVETPVFEYNVTTELMCGFLSFHNFFGSAIEVKFNGVVLGEETWYYLDFVDGENTIEITVTSEDGENTNIYVINITRNRSSQALIQGLSIGGVLDYVETPLFEYNIITEFKGGHLGFQNSYGATIEVEFNGVVLGEETWYYLDFVDGENTIEITVVSEDGENNNTYVINITRNRSSQAVIEDLRIDGILEYVETPVFEYDNLTTTRKTSYLNFDNPYGAAIEVKFNNAVLGDKTWYYLDFVDGENTIEINVVSEDGENTNIYAINITRDRSSQALIKSLRIDGVLEYVETPDFEYNNLITTRKTSSLDFDNPYGAAIEVKFNNTALGEETWYELDFVDGENTIEITVVSEDGENNNTYVINITRNPSSQAVIEDLNINGILEYIETPDFEYNNLITTRKTSPLSFNNLYGAAIEVKFNDTVLGENTNYWHHYYLNFVDGENTIEITVVSEDGENNNTYVINITRNPSSQAVIEDLNIDGILEYVETPDFEYNNLTTTRKKSSLSFDNPYGAAIEVKFNNTVLGDETWYYLNFVDGENTIEITVVSEDGENNNTYVINITRNPSSQAVIENLNIDGILEYVETPVFEYDNLTTTRKKSSLSFDNLYGAAIEVKFNNAVLGDGTYTYYNLNFAPGENIVEIKVVSEDRENTNIYVINITRNLSSQAVIQGLSIEDALEYIETPLFEYDNLTTTRKTSYLDFDNPYGATTEMRLNGTFLGKGTFYRLNFAPGGNIVEIKVTSSNGENTNIYTINITRNLSSQALIEYLSIDDIFWADSAEEFEYTEITKRKTEYMSFQNSYGATTEVKLNGSTVLGEDTGFRSYYRLDFAPGENIVEIEVTSANGENTNIYTINITRNLSTQAVIESLRIDGVLESVETPVFEYDNLTTTRKKSYLGFDNPYGATTEVKLNGTTVLSEDASYSSNYYRLDFVPGENIVEITVRSSDGENTNIYTINITRNLSSQAVIEYLYIGVWEDYIYSPGFEYTEITEFKSSSLSFNNPYGATTQVKFNGNVLGEETWYELDFIPGENIVEITVRSSDGENTNIYTINISRILSPNYLSELAEGLADLAGEYVNSPYIGGALGQVENHVADYLNATGEAGVIATVVEAVAPAVQADGTTYIGRYTVTFTRGAETVNKVLTYTQTRKPKPLQTIADGLADLAEEYEYAGLPHIDDAQAQVENHVADYLNATGEAGVIATVVEAVAPAVQADGTTYIGRYTVTFTRGAETVDKVLTYTQTRKPKPLQTIADGLADLAEEYEYAGLPHIDDARAQVENHVADYLNATGDAGVIPTVVETAAPAVQADGTTYIGRYTVTFTRGAETVNKVLTYTQTRKPKPLQTIADGLADLAEEYEYAGLPHIDDARAQVENHVANYLNATGDAGVIPTVVETAAPAVQADGTTYIGRYTVTFTRGAETVNKVLTYTQTRKPKPLQTIADGLADLAGEYVNLPYIGGALGQVENHVADYLNATGDAGVIPTVVETAAPAVQADGTTYIGRYTVTFTRGAETVNKVLTYTQTKKMATLQALIDGLANLAGEYVNSPYIGGALGQVNRHVTRYIETNGVTGIVIPTVVETAAPAVQADGTTYIGRYTVTFTRGAETVNKVLTYTQTKKMATLQALIDGLANLAGEYVNSPYIGGALGQVNRHVTRYIETNGVTGIVIPTVVETAAPAVQADGTTYIGRYTVTFTRGAETVNKVLTYTQTKKMATLQALIDGLANLAGEYVNSPYIGGALGQVNRHVTRYIETNGVTGIVIPTVVETAAPAVQADGTTYIGRYTVTFTRGAETVNKVLTYTQTKKMATLQALIDGLANLAGEYVNSPYIGGALGQVNRHVTRYIETNGVTGIVIPTVVETAAPAVQADGTTYIGRYTVTFTRGAETVNKVLTYTQTKKMATLQALIDGLANLAGEYVNSPYIGGALGQVNRHVTRYIETNGVTGIVIPTVVETAAPAVQADGTTYIGRYTVTFTRGAETVNKVLTYTQTKKMATLQALIDGLANLAGEYVNSPYIGGALGQVNRHVTRYIETNGVTGIVIPTVVETAAPAVQADGTTYIGRYTVTFTRGAETVNKVLTYTQTKK